EKKRHTHSSTTSTRCPTSPDLTTAPRFPCLPAPPPPAYPATRHRRPPRFTCIQALPPSCFPCPEAPLTQPPACHLTSFPHHPLLRWASHRYQPASEPSLALDRTVATAHDGDRATGTVPRWGSSRRHRPTMGIAPLQPHRPTSRRRDPAAA
uniref:Uncharacterized protein n=1 Tax=Triticum urartu TaxID=4572 RepID=A0A8R7PRN9_TRIUA